MFYTFEDLDFDLKKAEIDELIEKVLNDKNSELNNLKYNYDEFEKEIERLYETITEAKETMAIMLNKIKEDEIVLKQYVFYPEGDLCFETWKNNCELLKSCYISFQSNTPTNFIDVQKELDEMKSVYDDLNFDFYKLEELRIA